MILLNCIGYKWEKAKVTGALHRYGEAALILEARACDATWQNLALVVQEFAEEIGVFVIDVLDPVALEAAILLGHVGRLNLIYSSRADASIFVFTV
jgi:hypothetical protein